MNDISVILPSYKPDEKLVETVKSFEEAGFDDIIVVDDGGGSEYNHFFDELRGRESCTVLVHSVNRGKGAALKTAFKWYSENRSGLGAVTADGDGQHCACDVLAVADEMRKTGNIVLGVRDFSMPDVPARSRFGNRATSRVFHIFVGLRISDTQTGLRAIPSSLMPLMIDVPGDRYEYETNALLEIKKSSLDFSEIKIKTVYIDDNQTSHFRPFRDSAKIYGLIFKYIFTSSFIKFMGSSMLCYSIDWVLFTLLHAWLIGVFGETSIFATAIPTVSARIVSSLLNFCINRKIFDEGDGRLGWIMCKYYILAGCLLSASTVSVYFVSLLLNRLNFVSGFINAEWLQPILKLPIDLLLYLISYNVQRKFVFKKVGDN